MLFIVVGQYASMTQSVLDELGHAGRVHPVDCLGLVEREMQGDRIRLDWLYLLLSHCYLHRQEKHVIDFMLDPIVFSEVDVQAD